VGKGVFSSKNHVTFTHINAGRVVGGGGGGGPEMIIIIIIIIFFKQMIIASLREREGGGGGGGEGLALGKFSRASVPDRKKVRKIYR